MRNAPVYQCCPDTACAFRVDEAGLAVMRKAQGSDTDASSFAARPVQSSGITGLSGIQAICSGKMIRAEEYALKASQMERSENVTNCAAVSTMPPPNRYRNGKLCRMRFAEDQSILLPYAPQRYKKTVERKRVFRGERMRAPSRTYPSIIKMFAASLGSLRSSENSLMRVRLFTVTRGAGSTEMREISAVRASAEKRKLSSESELSEASGCEPPAQAGDSNTSLISQR